MTLRLGKLCLRAWSCERLPTHTAYLIQRNRPVTLTTCPKHCPPSTTTDVGKPRLRLARACRLLCGDWLSTIPSRPAQSVSACRFQDSDHTLLRIAGYENYTLCQITTESSLTSRSHVPTAAGFREAPTAFGSDQESSKGDCHA